MPDCLGSQLLKHHNNPVSQRWTWGLYPGNTPQFPRTAGILLPLMGANQLPAFSRASANYFLVEQGTGFHRA
ncbi:UNVERIFIED_CONTAM: hypothetical protein FKN15_025474 [Acipenser sinensis]